MVMDQCFQRLQREGRWLGNRLDMTTASSDAPEEMSAQQFWATYAKPHGSETLLFDDTLYHRLDTDRVPVGYADVDVKWEDNGELLDCTMVAGSIGIRVTSR
ncbi:hypothetical protein C8F04DRAFT_1273905 [Mycena alexandri]|uniref:Uncharacterized protein n=1 Tax=Mycena alexandri TaxID=1745969 RepID=A0AAD6S5N0_9AGAR|nr:hypothetical protein C8F04DRAFT_1273905 [Mycena alexandri]